MPLQIPLDLGQPFMARPRCHPRGSPHTGGARSAHPAFGHSSPASGSWSAALSGSPAPWCSPGGGGRGCQGSALSRWKLSAHTQDRDSVSAGPGESLSREICHHWLSSDGAAVPFPSSQTRYVCLTRIPGVGWCLGQSQSWPSSAVFLTNPIFSINLHGLSWVNPGPSSWPPPLLWLLISSLEPLLGIRASLHICNPDLEQCGQDFLVPSGPCSQTQRKLQTHDP